MLVRAVTFALVSLALTACAAETSEPAPVPAPEVELDTVTPAVARCPLSRKRGECPNQETCVKVKRNGATCLDCVCLGGN